MSLCVPVSSAVDSNHLPVQVRIEGVYVCVLLRAVLNSEYDGVHGLVCPHSVHDQNHVTVFGYCQSQLMEYCLRFFFAWQRV